MTHNIPVPTSLRYPPALRERLIIMDHEPDYLTPYNAVLILSRGPQTKIPEFIESDIDWVKEHLFESVEHAARIEQASTTTNDPCALSVLRHVSALASLGRHWAENYAKPQTLERAFNLANDMGNTANDNPPFLAADAFGALNSLCIALSGEELIDEDDAKQWADIMLNINELGIVYEEICPAHVMSFLGGAAEVYEEVSELG